MSPLDRRPPPRPDRPPALDQQPEPGAVREPRARPPTRTQTLPGLHIPVKPPPLPSEFAPTTPAPALDAPTVRATPASGTEAVSQAAAEAQVSALLDERARDKARIAQLERDARAAAEARNVQGSFPPSISEKSTDERAISSDRGHKRVETAKTDSGPPDAAIGRSVRWLLSKAWPFIVAAAGLGGGAVGALKPAADPAKADATLANVEAMRSDLALIREQLAGVLKREAARDAYIRCIDEGMIDLGTQLLPAQDRQGAAQPLRAFVDRCQRLRP